MQEAAFGEDAARKHDEGAEQLRRIFRDEIRKLRHKDYSDAIVLFYTDSEGTPQAVVEELIDGSIDDIRTIRTIEVCFIQDIPTT